MMIPGLAGQDPGEQGTVSLPAPLQGEPPLAGTGLSQFLVLLLLPLPQDTEQLPQLPQPLQPPWTGPHRIMQTNFLVSEQGPPSMLGPPAMRLKHCLEESALMYRELCGMAKVEAGTGDPEFQVRPEAVVVQGSQLAPTVFFRAV